jgi:hypothetical protein
VDELIAVPKRVLDEIPPPLRSAFEELHRVLRVRDLAEHEHGDLRGGVAELRRDLDAFVGPRRRHADVRQHHIRLLLLHGSPDGRQVVALSHDVDVVRTGEDPGDPLPREIAVVSDQYSDRHLNPFCIAPAHARREVVPTVSVDRGARLPAIDAMTIHPAVRVRVLPPGRCVSAAISDVC